MRIGDHLVSSRFGYSHHGLYIGNQQVIHYAGLANGLSGGAIEITSVSAFANGNNVRVKHHSSRRYNAEQSVNRAHSRLGEDWYNVLLNNCEHFVSWCINGVHSSAQVNNAINAAAAAYAATKLLNTQATGKQVAQVASAVGSQWLGGESGRQAAVAAAPHVSKLAASVVAGGSTSIATSSVVSVASGIGGFVSIGAISTIAAPIAVGYIAYSVFDYFWD
jgi:hypothetical protein